jgi:hypothetical protein
VPRGGRRACAARSLDVCTVGRSSAPRASCRPTVPAACPSGVRLRSREEVTVTCEFACEDPEAILSLADDLGRFVADLWLAGKLDALSLSDEEPADADEE